MVSWRCGQLRSSSSDCLTREDGNHQCLPAAHGGFFQDVSCSVPPWPGVVQILAGPSGRQGPRLPEALGAFCLLKSCAKVGKDTELVQDGAI